MWAICVCHDDGTIGWLLNQDTEVKIYPTAEDAEKAMKQIRKDKRYSWNVKTEVREYSDESRKIRRRMVVRKV